MLSRQFAMRGIPVDARLRGDLPEVYANPLQLEQVFINLATNARDAIEATGRGQGTIAIHDAMRRRISSRSSSGTTECGMSDEPKAKVFNPFFTTKEVGKGMGLGIEPELRDPEQASWLDPGRERAR